MGDEPKSEAVISPHPEFELYSANELKDEIRRICEDINFATDHGGDKLFITWKLSEKRMAEAELARRNGTAHLPAQEDFWPDPLTMLEFNKIPADLTRWAWKQMIPFGEVGMICGEPRAGKTTLALNLALAVSRGVPFLSRSTTKSPCFYVAIDNSYQDMRVLTDQLQIGDYDEILIHTGQVPKRATDWVLDKAVKDNIKVVIIDTIERFYPGSDINKPDFGKAMAPMDLEAKRIGITVIYVHHATAHPSDASKIGSLFMGHTTVKGMAPYYMELYRVGNSRHRILSSDLRSGRNIESMYIKLDQKTQWCVNGGSLEDALMDEYTDKVMDFVKNNPECTRGQIREGIEGRKQMVNMAISKALKDEKLEKVDPEVNNGTPKHPELLVIAGTLIDKPKALPELKLIK